MNKPDSETFDKDNSTILVVDDNKDALRLIATILSMNNYNVVTAANGIEGLQRLSNVNCDLILSDILMPEMDGYLFCRKVRENKKWKDIIFVFYTATYIDYKDEELAVTFGANKFLRKPLETSELLQIVNTLLRDKKLGKFKPVKSKTGKEDEDLKLYNERLVNKLEKNVVGLEKEIFQKRVVEDELKNLIKEFEQKLIDRDSELEVLNTELNAFIHSVSQDIQLPLRAIKGLSDALMENYNDRLEGEGLRHLMLIDDHIKKMEKMIHELVSFSDMEQREMQPSVIDMFELTKVLSYELRLLNPQLKIEFKIGDLHKAFGDPAMIRRVMMNLLSNAIKFGSVRDVSVVEVGSKMNDENIVYYVKDNGIGFDSGNVENLSGAFQRSTSSAELDSAGIGLVVVERIVGKHKGRVWAEGKVDKGSVFYFSLPLP